MKDKTITQIRSGEIAAPVRHTLIDGNQNEINGDSAAAGSNNSELNGNITATNSGDTGITVLAGVLHPQRDPYPVFSPEAIAFLSAVSAEIAASELHNIPEIAAFGFWCRNAHLETLKQRHASPFPRLGRGMVFHITPSNVPTMFAYSYAIGLLAGNANIVRLSARNSEISRLLCACIGRVLNRPDFESVKKRSSFISYNRDTAVTAAYTADCDARVIWGGDETIRDIRTLPLPPHAVELVFPDRWSFALFSQAASSRAGDEMLALWAHRFYNDTYLMDQNACSTPHLVVWEADGGNPAVRFRWWEKVAKEAQTAYQFDAYQAARKYERLCLSAMALPEEISVRQYAGNLLYVAHLKTPPVQASETLRGTFGFFFETEIRNKEELLPLLSYKVQTLCAEGYRREELAQFFAQHHAAGIDRIIALGQAMEMDTIWDGKDLIAALSRLIV